MHYLIKFTKIVKIKFNQFIDLKNLFFYKTLNLKNQTMPLYEFFCTKCNYQDELLLKVGQSDIKICPKCKQPGLRRKTSLPSFHLKGGGWYKDNYETKKSANLSADSGDKKKESPPTTQIASKPAVNNTPSKSQPTKNNPKANSKLAS